MRISFGDRLQSTLNQLTQRSSTFKKWWDEPTGKGGLSRKEQFHQIQQERPKVVQSILDYLDKYLKKPLSQRHIQTLNTASAKKTEDAMPEGSLSKVVKELDAVLKAYSTKPLPRPPSQPFPKAIQVPPLPPKLPHKPLPTAPTKPVPPVPLSEEEMEINIASLKEHLEDVPQPDISTFQKAQVPSQARERSNLPLAGQRTVKPQRPLPPVPDEKKPPVPPTAPASTAKPRPMAPPRRKAPMRPDKNLSAPVAGPSIPVSKPPAQPVNGPSEAHNQDISRMMQALVKMRMDKAVLRDILLGDKGTLSSNPERQLRGMRILQERGIIDKNVSQLPALDSFAREKTIELLGLLDDNERKLQANVDGWYEKHGGGIQF